MKHGHHPGHGFKPASEEATLDILATRLCLAGRNVSHYAVCDGCDDVCRAASYLINGKQTNSI